MNRWVQWGLALVAVIVAGSVFFAVAAAAAAKSRDIQRLSDITEIRVALERYYFMRNRYPVAEEPLTLGGGNARVLCATDAGWHAQPDRCEDVVSAPVPAGPRAGAYGYRYTSNGEAYRLDFYMEKSDAGLAPGWHKAGAEKIE